MKTAVGIVTKMISLLLLYPYLIVMDSIKKTLTAYCKQYVTTNDQAKKFLNYYNDSIKEMYWIKDEESYDYLSILNQYINTDECDLTLQTVLDDIFLSYYEEKIY